MDSPDDQMRKKRPMFSPDRSNEKERRLNANLIERRRMQNINLGFNSLKKLLPPAEKKQTKAAILQQAVQHIARLQGTVVQVRENNNLMRQTLEDERKRSFVQGKQLEALLAEKFSKRGLPERTAYHSHAQYKPRPLTPPHDDHNDRAYDRCPPAPFGDEQAGANEYRMLELSSCRDTKRRAQDSMGKRRYLLWNASDRRFNQKIMRGRRAEEPGPSRDGSRDPRLPLANDVPREMRGNNLHCIVDAISLIEKS